MDARNQDMAMDERHKASRIEFALFALSRLVIFSFVTSALGWLLHGILAFLLLAIEHAFAV